MTCRGHDLMLTSESSSVAETGSKTFYMNRPTSESSWLNGACANSGDCPASVNNAECFKGGHCLCTPGYYYSRCRDGCVPDCPTSNLQSTILRYPFHHISGHNMETISECYTSKTAQAHCLNNPECLSFDISPPTCWLQKVTALDKPDDFEYKANNDYYQRTCL
ncbi:hypothetical protein V1264_000305 [Littorina saxatilis]|uniref:Apple domain-containing protein n=1 Tax=Littorina saxatilis TaxID=31220 RepID=A0AAN9BZJ6_9CAEN